MNSHSYAVWLSWFGSRIMGFCGSDVETRWSIHFWLFPCWNSQWICKWMFSYPHFSFHNLWSYTASVRTISPLINLYWWRERRYNPPEMETHQLLLVSGIGLAINLWGMWATGGHHHHGHSHGHDHRHIHAAPKMVSLGETAMSPTD